MIRMVRIKDGNPGKLITHGSGSGSADRVPETVMTFFGHKGNDMDPANLAKGLDNSPSTGKGVINAQRIH